MRAWLYLAALLLMLFSLHVTELAVMSGTPPAGKLQKPLWEHKQT